MAKASAETEPAIISNDVAKKLAKDFTAQHPATVLGMAKACVQLRAGFHLTSWKVKAVRKNGCEVAVTCCRGDLCEIKNGFFELSPPLESADDFATRIPALHQAVCQPNPAWLVTKPEAFLIVATCAGLAYGIFIGQDAMADVLATQAPRLEQGITTVFGSVQNFGHAVYASFWFAILVHTFEAGIGILYCRTLGLGSSSTALWVFLIFLVGFPILKEIQALVLAQEPPSESKKSKST